MGSPHQREKEGRREAKSEAENFCAQEEARGGTGRGVAEW